MKLDIFECTSRSAVVPVYRWEHDACAVQSAQSKDSFAMVGARDMFLDVKCDAPLHTAPSGTTAKTDWRNRGPIRWHESPRPAPSVSYTLVARIQCQEEGDATLRYVEAKQAVTLLPVSDVEPPTCVNDFLGEFVLSESHGAAEAQARDPARPSGCDRVRAAAARLLVAWRRWRVHGVRSICRPQRAALIGALKWEYAPAGDLVCGASLVPSGSTGHGHVWRARLTLAVKPPETLPPAFCGTLIARLYSLLVIVRVPGARGKKCDLELPSQVVHQGDDSSDPCTTPAPPVGGCKGPGALLGEQAELPEYDDRWTEASWRRVERTRR
ncbi:hypothetical protein GGTG_05150 [Gaeumannomyces tritici R3-111a-1]|uniref:Uncharacterized protein n=1 Tax=Gaeumannomyces tritici (strain R3-111a-1) TaxID=644352 RepID=J3NV38_GAET3|nr:hypothetical protein GGTG_05150 [Gaeumannomyces tritici R3-111a-1]EJT75213.1 hypothetical protein GGTG_05150 [Gaeumannomyces tritici R3-111a-1]